MKTLSKAIIVWACLLILTVLLAKFAWSASLRPVRMGAQWEGIIPPASTQLVAYGCDAANSGGISCVNFAADTYLMAISNTSTIKGQGEALYGLMLETPDGAQSYLLIGEQWSNISLARDMQIPQPYMFIPAGSKIWYFLYWDNAPVTSFEMQSILWVSP